MNTKNIHFFCLAAMLLLIFSARLAGCSTLPAQAGPQLEATPDTTVYKEFTLPFPEEVSFELPDDWDFWANAGYLSPDDGKTYAGVRMAWMEEGHDAEEALYNEGSKVHEKTTVMVVSKESEDGILPRIHLLVLLEAKLDAGQDKEAAEHIDDPLGPFQQRNSGRNKDSPHDKGPYDPPEKHLVLVFLIYGKIGEDHYENENIVDAEGIFNDITR